MTDFSNDLTGLVVVGSLDLVPLLGDSVMKMSLEKEVVEEVGKKKKLKKAGLLSAKSCCVSLKESEICDLLEIESLRLKTHRNAFVRNGLNLGDCHDNHGHGDHDPVIDHPLLKTWKVLLEKKTEKIAKWAG